MFVRENMFSKGIGEESYFDGLSVVHGQSVQKTKSQV